MGRMPVDGRCVLVAYTKLIGSQWLPKSRSNAWTHCVCRLLRPHSLTAVLTGSASCCTPQRIEYRDSWGPLSPPSLYLSLDPLGPGCIHLEATCPSHPSKTFCLFPSISCDFARNEGMLAHVRTCSPNSPFITSFKLALQM